MRFKNDFDMCDIKKEEENKGFCFNKKILLSSKEAKEKITYKDSEGFCTFLYEGKEIEGVILTVSSKGDITLGIKEVNV